MGIEFIGGGAGTGGALSGSSITVNSGGTIASGESGVLYITSLETDETINFLSLSLLQEDGTAVPTGLDLIIARLDNTGGAEKVKELLVGDGNSIYDRLTGEPYASYQHTGAGAETYAILIDNGNFNTGTGTAQDVTAGIIANIE
jgi:hypothetical protein